MAKEFIYVKLTKEWGGFAIGDVVRFGANKGQSRIDLGFGVEVPKQKAVNDPVPVKRPKVETATAPVAAETAVAEPVISDKSDISDEPDELDKSEKAEEKPKLFKKKK